MPKRHSSARSLLVFIGALLVTFALQGVASAGPALYYQGRLLDPATGSPKADGVYSMVFKLYEQASDGAAFWTEITDVSVSDGIFNVLLGETTPLNPLDFDGTDVWLGISVGADPQMTPRQPLAYVPHALFAEIADDADTLDGMHAYEFSASGHSHPPRPTAFGSVRYDGVLGTGSYNVDSVAWNATYSRYEIDITDIYYSIDDMTVASLSGDAGSCPGGSDVRQSSVSGHLLIYVVASDGSKIQCSFRFITYAD